MKDVTYNLMLSDKEKEANVMEAVLKRNVVLANNPLAERLKKYNEWIREIYEADDYTRYGKYLVKESFEGDVTLTQLLTEYIERTASLKY